MLTRENRLTSAELFRAVVRHGRRGGGPLLVVHLLIDSGEAPAQVGFVVSKAVGPAVTRNLVKRRLRHHARERVGSLPGSSVLVVRALPAAAGASYAELAGAFDRCLDRALSAPDKHSTPRGQMKSAAPAASAQPGGRG